MIEICIRCRRVLRKPAEAELLVLDDLFPGFVPDEEGLVDSKWYGCTDLVECAVQQEENKKEHQREIEHRMGGGLGLVVIQDVFGHRWGYGNYYVAVQPGEDPDKIAKEYTDRSNVLVVGAILPAKEKETA